MKRSTSFPTIVCYTKYSDCQIKDALLAEMRYRGNIITLPQIGNMLVNWFRLLGSYGKAFEKLRKMGYDIETVVSQKDKHTITKYVLKNPNFNSTSYEDRYTIADSE
jgi:hypothetical protein